MKVVPKPEKNDLIAAVAMLRRNMPYLIEHAIVQAELRKARFDAHVNAGFTEAQALELCKEIQ